MATYDRPITIRKQVDQKDGTQGRKLGFKAAATG